MCVSAIYERPEDWEGERGDRPKISCSNCIMFRLCRG